MAYREPASMPAQVFVCIPCGKPAPAPGTCARCGDTLLDGAREDVRELIDDINGRKRRAHEQRFLWISIAAAFVVMFGVWSIPGYWALRRFLFALPLLIDQQLLLLGLSFLFVKLTRKLFAPPQIVVPK